MKYSIIKCINGNYAIHAEGITSLANAKTQFHGLCQTLWNAQDVLTAEVAIVDEQLDIGLLAKLCLIHNDAVIGPDLII